MYIIFPFLLDKTFDKKCLSGKNSSFLPKIARLLNFHIRILRIPASGINIGKILLTDSKL